MDHIAMAYATRNARAAQENQQSAESWKAYARELESKLATSNANLEAMRTLKDVAIRELGKVDPKNYLMNQANRQKIVNDAYYGKKT